MPKTATKRTEEHELLAVDGREISISNPERCSFRRPDTPSSIWCTTTSRWPRARCAPPADGPMCWCAIRTASTASSSFRSGPPQSRPAWIEVVTLRFPSGREAEEVVPRDAAALAWMANLACLELHPHPVRADDLDHPDELRVDLDPVPGVAVDANSRSCARRAAMLDRLRAHRLAEDFGLARHARLRAHRAALDVRRSAARGSGAGARSRAARAGTGNKQMVEGRAPRRISSTTTRTPRTGPWLPRTRCGRRPTRACLLRSRGTKSTPASPAISRWQRCRRALPTSAICTQGIDRARWLARALARAFGAPRARRPWRCAVAAAIQEAAGRTAARATVAPRRRNIR